MSHLNLVFDSGAPRSYRAKPTRYRLSGSPKHSLRAELPQLLLRHRGRDEGSPDWTRGYRIDANAPGTPFGGQCSRQADEPMFRRIVGTAVADAGQSRN